MTAAERTFRPRAQIQVPLLAAASMARITGSLIDLGERCQCGTFKHLQEPSDELAAEDGHAVLAEMLTLELYVLLRRQLHHVICRRKCA